MPIDEKPSAKIDILHIEDMKLAVEGSRTFEFKRLQYIGCPRLNNQGEFDKDTVLIDANRDSFIREVFDIVKDKFNDTVYRHMLRLAQYLAYIDGNKIKVINNDYFEKSTSHKYIKKLIKEAESNPSKSVAANAKSTISFFLREVDRVLESKNLPPVDSSRTPILGLDAEIEIKPIMRILIPASTTMMNHVIAGTLPDTHPVFNGKKFNEEADRQKLHPSTKVQRMESAKYSGVRFIGTGNIGYWDKKDISSEQKATLDERAFYNEVALFFILIIFCLTGMNPSVLAKMRFSDVRFSQLRGDHYIFEGEKERAGRLDIDNALGFKKTACKLIELWLVTSRIMQKNHGTDWLFPYFVPNEALSVTNFSHRNAIDYRRIRIKLSYLGVDASYFTASRLRETKSNTLMAVTNSIIMTSESLGNKPSTVAKHYGNGIPKEHDKSLASSMDATYSIGKGERINDAIEKAKAKRINIISEYDYKERLNKGEKPAAKTPSGSRCSINGEIGESVERQLKVINKPVKDSEKKCTNFLKCFKCEHHLIVAAVNDIWMMLSFQDVLSNLFDVPSYKSYPKEKLRELLEDVKDILILMKDKNSKGYNEGIKKFDQAPHPLFATLMHFEDLREVFGQ